MIRSFLASCALVVAMTSASQGAIIFSNTFDGPTDNSEFYSAGQVLAPNVTSQGVGRPGYTNFGGSDVLRAGELRTFTAAPDVLNFTRFFSFIMTPTAGAVIDFDSFTYDGFETLAAGATEGASKFAFRSDINGFGGSGDIGVATLGGTTIDLTGAEFQGITGPVEFRLYIQAEDGATTSADSTYSLNGFEFNGTVTAVPEPSSLLAMVGLSGLGVIYLRRRKARK